MGYIPEMESSVFEPANDNIPLERDMMCHTILDGQLVFTCGFCGSELFGFTFDINGYTVIVCGGCGNEPTIDKVFGEFKYD